MPHLQPDHLARKSRVKSVRVRLTMHFYLSVVFKVVLRIFDA